MIRVRYACIPKKGGGFIRMPLVATEHREKIERRWEARATKLFTDYPVNPPVWVKKRINRLSLEGHLWR